MRILASISTVCVALFLGSNGSALALDTSEEDHALKLLGKYIFFDKISRPQRMACVTCHDSDTGGTGSVSGVNLHQVAITGADPHTSGSLKPPTNAYASFIPPFHFCTKGVIRPGGQSYCGGNFWNGRAEGTESALLPGATQHIGVEVFQAIQDVRVLEYGKYFGPTADQALKPMPVEQNIERKAVCEHVASAAYAPLYQAAWGEEIDCSDAPVQLSALDVDHLETAFDISFKRLMLAVSAWQHSSELNSFSSKRDLALRAELACLEAAPDRDPAVCSHADYLGSPGKFPLAGFTKQENLGHDLFYNTTFLRGPTKPFPKLPVTNCSFCHQSDPVHGDGEGLFERYTDDAYHNIGVPANPELPAQADPGLSGHAQIAPPADAGGFKTPTLRNVDKRKGKGFIKAYTHNGWFKSLESLVHFYNTSQIKARCAGTPTEKEALANDCWPAPEWQNRVAQPVLVGNIGMIPQQEAALVAYLKTLTDVKTPKPPAPYK